MLSENDFLRGLQDYALRYCTEEAQDAIASLRAKGIETIKVPYWGNCTKGEFGKPEINPSIRVEEAVIEPLKEFAEEILLEEDWYLSDSKGKIVFDLGG